MLHAFKQYIESNRRSGTTTALVKIAKECHGDIVVATIDAKQRLIKEFGMSKEHVYTCSEIADGQFRGRKMSAIFFDTDAVWQLITKKEDLEQKPVIVKPCTSCGWDGYSQPEETPRYARSDYNGSNDPNFKYPPTGEKYQTPQISITNCCFDGYNGLYLDTKGGLNISLGDGYAGNYTKQINVKLTEEDNKEIHDINGDFFEGEASNSMMGRILLRKGIQFYKKLRNSIDKHSL